MFWFRFATFVLGTVALVIGLVTFTPPLLILGAGLLTTPVVSEAISWEHKQPKHKLMPPEKVAQLEKELGITPENRLATAYEENEKWIAETGAVLADLLMTDEEREEAKKKSELDKIDKITPAACSHCGGMGYSGQGCYKCYKKYSALPHLIPAPVTRRLP